jgi:NADPH:quinone reductase-like Zn-dependent oxidoreductase
MELAGKIEAVGKDVTLFKKGDEVFASTMWAGFGGYAEYKCMAEDGVLAKKPANMTFEEAAVIHAGELPPWELLKWRISSQPTSGKFLKFIKNRPPLKFSNYQKHKQVGNKTRGFQLCNMLG